MEVYKKVLKYIDNNNLEKSTIAKKAGLSSEAFKSMLSGKTKMHADDLRAICLVLNVSPEVFIDAQVINE